MKVRLKDLKFAFCQLKLVLEIQINQQLTGKISLEFDFSSSSFLHYAPMFQKSSLFHKNTRLSFALIKKIRKKLSKNFAFKTSNKIKVIMKIINNKLYLHSHLTQQPVSE